MDPSLLDTTFWLTVGAIFVLLLCSAFFSASETALTAASRAKLRAQADKGARGAETALKVTEDSERMIGALLLGNNLVNILAASLATALFTRLIGESGVALATLVMTALVLIFAEVLPKTWAITAPEPAALRLAPVVRVVVRLLSPLVAAVRAFVRLVLRAFGVRADPDSRFLALREEIAGAIALGHHEGVVEREDRDRLLGALGLSDRTVEEVMRHRSEIEMIDADAEAGQIVHQALASPHTRLPLWRGEAENIVGVLHAKDLLRAVEQQVQAHPGDPGAMARLDITAIARKPYFVPETTALDEQMRQFLRHRRHFALVVDEYGALRGLITLEDILEEIVGEIEDEFDLTVERAALTPGSTDVIEVEGSMAIRDLNRAMDWNLPDEEANTVAGLLIHEVQAIPAEGQVFAFHGFRFEVMARQDNRITRLKLRRL
ncbi:MAG: HlyC/CorC family transporter [Gemmobacter sp.]